MTATQAPTPGPLSGDGWIKNTGRKPDDLPDRFDVLFEDGAVIENITAAIWSRNGHGDIASWRPHRLAPTAPVEASGSERETVFDGNAHDLVQTAQALAIAIERVPDWLMNDNLLTAHCHAQVLIADLPAALRPQPSGETREADDLIDDEWRALVGDGPDAFANPASINHDEFRTAIRGVLSRARPLALGGQQGEVRETIVKTIAFLKRDLDTPRINDTVETLLLDLVKADAILRGEA